MTDAPHTTEVCEACGEPATHRDAAGVPLCDDDWRRLCEQWANLTDEEKQA